MTERDQLAGLRVETLSLDFRLCLNLSDGSRIAISNKFSIQRGNETWEADPNDGVWEPAKKAGVDVLIGQTIGSNDFENGSLTVAFNSGYVLHVDADYEPWEIAMKDGRKWISLEDGDIAEWGPYETPEH